MEGGKTGKDVSGNTSYPTHKTCKEAKRQGCKRCIADLYSLHRHPDATLSLRSDIVAGDKPFAIQSAALDFLFDFPLKLCYAQITIEFL